MEWLREGAVEPLYVHLSFHHLPAIPECDNALTSSGLFTSTYLKFWLYLFKNHQLRVKDV